MAKLLLAGQMDSLNWESTVVTLLVKWLFVTLLCMFLSTEFWDTHSSCWGYGQASVSRPSVQPQTAASSPDPVVQPNHWGRPAFASLFGSILPCLCHGWTVSERLQLIYKTSDVGGHSCKMFKKQPAGKHFLSEFGVLKGHWTSITSIFLYLIL